MTATIVRSFGEMATNAIGLDLQVTVPICEGMNRLLSSFQALYLQYQKHHFVVEGSEFYMLHEYFQDSYEAVAGHTHDLGERLNNLGGIPAASFSQLAQLCSFTPEPDGVFACRQMIAHDLQAEQTILTVLRQQCAQAESLGDRATRYLYEQILLKTEERAAHLDHFLTQDSLTVGWR